MGEFEQLVDEHYRPLYRFALSLSRDPDRAGDLVQETFCRWAEKGDQLRDRSKAKTWLFTTLHREFLNQRRKHMRYVEEPLEGLEEAVIEEERGSERQMDGQRALELLGGIDEVYRAPLVLFYLQQHSYKEIAVILEVPMGTVMSRIARGKELLRKRMNLAAGTAPKNILKLQPEALRQQHG